MNKQVKVIQQEYNTINKRIDAKQKDKIIIVLIYINLNKKKSYCI